MNMQINMINVESIVPNRFQPRKKFDESELQELADSIKQHGMLQPLVLRKLGNKFEIIAGERRYKAAIINGMIQVPAIVMNLDDATSAEVALIENVQRKDLTPIEEAQSYKQILQLGQMTQDEMAKKMGRNQSTISNKLRLLNLSPEVQQALLQNKISERHARSLLTLKNHDLENKILNKIIENRLTVRETDNEIKNILQNQSEEEILDFDTEEKPEEIEEILDFDENANLKDESVEKEQLESVIPAEENKNNITAKRRNKFFNFEEENNMNQNNVQQQNTVNNPYSSMPQTNQTEVNGQNTNYNIPQQNNQNFGQQYVQQPQTYQPNEQFQNNYGIPQQNLNIPNYNNAPQNNQIFQQPQQQYMQQPQPNEMQSNYVQQYPQQPTNFQQIPNNNQYDYQSQPQIPATQLPQSQVLPQYGDANMGVQPEEPEPQSMISQQDITGAVSVIRNTIMNLQNNGYMLDAEEFDFENIHQITIKIQK